MPKNKGKGGKKFRRGKNSNETKRPLLLRDDEQNQCYGYIIKTLGNGRFDVNCYENTNGNFVIKSRNCLVRGSMRKRIWINMGDIVLVSIRDFQDSKADIMYKYEDYEVIDLVRLNEIPNIGDLNIVDNFEFNNLENSNENSMNTTSYSDVYNIDMNNDDESEDDEINDM
jgi:translation initiation factor 1A